MEVSEIIKSLLAILLITAIDIFHQGWEVKFILKVSGSEHII